MLSFRQSTNVLSLIFSIASAIAGGIAWYALTYMSLMSLPMISAYALTCLCVSTITGFMFSLFYLKSMLDTISWSQDYFRKDTGKAKPKLNIPFISLMMLGTMLSFPLSGPANIMRIIGLFHLFLIAWFTNKKDPEGPNHLAFLTALVLTLLVAQGIQAEWAEAIVYSFGAHWPNWLALVAIPGYISFSIKQLYEGFTKELGKLLNFAKTQLNKVRQSKSLGSFLENLFNIELTILAVIPHFLSESIHSLWGYKQQGNLLQGFFSMSIDTVNEMVIDLRGLFMDDHDHHHNHDHEHTPILPITNTKHAFSNLYRNPVIALSLITLLMSPLYLPLITTTIALPWPMSTAITFIAYRIWAKADKGISYAIFINLAAHVIALTTGITAAFLLKDVFTTLPNYFLYIVAGSALIVEGLSNEGFLKQACGFKRNEHSHESGHEPSIYQHIQNIMDTDHAPTP